MAPTACNMETAPMTPQKGEETPALLEASAWRLQFLMAKCSENKWEPVTNGLTMHVNFNQDRNKCQTSGCPLHLAIPPKGKPAIKACHILPSYGILATADGRPVCPGAKHHISPALGRLTGHPHVPISPGSRRRGRAGSPLWPAMTHPKTEL